MLCVLEAWRASRCAACGEEDAGQFDRDRCDTCGADAVAPVDNPHRVEALLGHLQFKDGSPSRVWMSEIQRNAAGFASDFVDQADGTLAKYADGRLTGLWEVPSEQTDSFIRCLTIVAQELGRQLPKEILEISAMLEEMPVSPDEHLRIDLMRLRAHTRVLPWDASGAITEREEDATL